jgi:hypothetical protein
LTVSTGTVANNEEPLVVDTNVPTDQNISVQLHVSVDIHADQFENNYYDTTFKKEGGSYDGSDDVFSKGKTKNNSAYDNTFSQNRKLICISEHSYNSMIVVSSQFQENIENLNTEGKTETANLQTKPNGITEIVQSDNELDSKEFEMKSLTEIDKEKPNIYDEYVAIKAERPSLNDNCEVVLTDVTVEDGEYVGIKSGMPIDNCEVVLTDDTVEADISTAEKQQKDDTYDDIECHISVSNECCINLHKPDIVHMENNGRIGAKEFVMSALNDKCEHMKRRSNGDNDLLDNEDVKSNGSCNDEHLQTPESNDDGQEHHDEGKYVAIQPETPVVIRHSEYWKSEDFDVLSDSTLQNDDTYDDVEFIHQSQETCKNLQHNGECGEVTFKMPAINKSCGENVKYEESDHGNLQIDDTYDDIEFKISKWNVQNCEPSSEI